MENIKISCKNINRELSAYDKEIIQRFTNEYKAKIERHFKDITSFEIYVKCHLKKSVIKRYDVDARLIVPGFKFESSSDEFKLVDALHKALERLLNEIERKAKISNQGNVFRGKQNVKKRKR